MTKLSYGHGLQDISNPVLPTK